MGGGWKSEIGRSDGEVEVKAGRSQRKDRHGGEGIW